MPHQRVKHPPRFVPLLYAQPLEPADARRHMPDLVVVDAIENGGALMVTNALQPGGHLGRDVETPSL